MRNILWILSLLAATLWGLNSKTAPPVTMVLISVWIFLTAKLQSFDFRSDRGHAEVLTDLLKWCLLTPPLVYGFAALS
jgi:hypothetical protein